MSTEKDGHTLTRKQLRELRLTGSTPVVSGEEAAAAQAAQTPKPSDGPAQTAPAEPQSADTIEPAPAEPKAADASSSQATPSAASDAPLTRRAARAQERGRTGPVPVVPTEQHDAADEPVVEAIVVEATVDEEPVVEELVVEELIIDVPVTEAPVAEAPAVAAFDAEESVPAFAPQPAQSTSSDAHLPSASPAETGEEDGAETDAEPERPMVGAAFGIGVKRAPAGPGIPTAFDDLLETGSAGSHKTASTLIFTPSPGAGSLSGPVASTGELLITGTYALPEGMGSQGHALGTTDGKDIDAVLIDGELAPSSSPTPIAASSAISTSKPAGEVIRPPVPDKGNKLTLTLAIVAGGLALALAAALIIAFTTGVLA
ncbi:hypothetical protein ACIPV2_06925 [Microbacterium sp. NPDC089987]|uniref:hypothetical protein n=1 Tax=Microbacterium sp. NPDC089987 TaxID=3364202 RepID=UPI00382A286F